MDGYISEAQHEKEMTRLETSNKRWFILCIILIILLVGTNAGWMIYENQFQDVVITQDAGDGVNNFVGGNGIIDNGE